MKEELKNLRMLVDLEAKLLEKLKDNLQKVRADGSVNMKYERIMIADLFEQIIGVRVDLFSHYNYFNTDPPKIVNEEQKQMLRSLENRIEKQEESFMNYQVKAREQLFIERKVKVEVKSMDDLIKNVRPVESSEVGQIRKSFQNILINSIEFNLTPEEKINWISIIKKTQLYQNNPSAFDKQLAKQEQTLQEELNLEKEINKQLAIIVNSSNPIEIKVKNILEQIERGNKGGFYKDYFLMNFLLSDAGKKLVNDINAKPFVLSMGLLNKISDKREDKEFFDKFMKEQSGSVLKNLDTALDQIISGIEASGQKSDDKILFARINRVYNFLDMLPKSLKSVELNNYLEGKLSEIFEKALAEKIPTEMQINYLLKYRDKFNNLELVKFDDKIQKMIEQKYDQYAWDLRNDLKLIGKNLKGERYTNYAEQINLIQRKIHDFESAFPDDQFKQKVPFIYELLNNELQRLTHESVEMIKKDNARNHADQRAKDFYSLYSKIWNMNELSRKIDAEPPGEIVRLCDSIKQTYSKEEIFNELNRFLKKDDKELTINGKLARLNLALNYMNIQNDPRAIKITQELLQGMPHGISRIVDNQQTSTITKLDKLDKYHLALKQAQIAENSELRSLLSRSEQQLRETLANDLTSLSRNLFKTFSPVDYINDSSYKHDFLTYPKKLQEYIVDDICKRADPEIRSLHISRWISVAEMSIKNGDIATAMTIFGSLAEQNVQQNHIALSLLSDREKQILLCADDWTKGNYTGYMTMLEDPKYCTSTMKVPHPTIMGARLELPRQRGEQIIDTNIPTQLFRMLERYVESVQATPPITTQTIILQSEINKAKDDNYFIERRVEKYERSNEKYAKAKEQNTLFSDKVKSANQQAKEQFIKNQASRTVSDVKENKYNLNVMMQNLDNTIVPLMNFQNNTELRLGFENLTQVAMLNDTTPLRPIKKIEPSEWNNFYLELSKVKVGIQIQLDAAQNEYNNQMAFLERNLKRQKEGTLQDADAQIRKTRQEIEKAEKRLVETKGKLEELNKIPKEMPEKITEEQFTIFNNNFKCSAKLVDGEFMWGSKSEGVSYKNGDKSFDRFQDMFVYQDGQVVIRDLAAQTRLAKEEIPKFKDDLFAQVVITLKEVQDMVNIDLRRELAKPESMFDMSDLRHHHTEFIFNIIDNRFNEMISKLEKSKNEGNAEQINHLISGLKQEQQKYVGMKNMVNTILNADEVELKAQQQKNPVYVAQPMSLGTQSQLAIKSTTLPIQQSSPQSSIKPEKSEPLSVPIIKSKPESDTKGFWATITGGMFAKTPQKPRSSSTADIFRTTASGKMDELRNQLDQQKGKEKGRAIDIGEFIYEINHISQGKSVTTIAYAKSLNEIAEKLSYNLNSTDKKLSLAIYYKDAHDQQIKGKLNIEFKRENNGNAFEVNTILQDMPSYAESSNTYERFMTILPGKYKGNINKPTTIESVEKKNTAVLQQEFSDVEKRAKQSCTEVAPPREEPNTSLRFKNP